MEEGTKFACYGRICHEKKKTRRPAAAAATTSFAVRDGTAFGNKQGKQARAKALPGRSRTW